LQNYNELATMQQELLFKFPIKRLFWNFPRATAESCEESDIRLLVT